MQVDTPKRAPLAPRLVVAPVSSPPSTGGANPRPRCPIPGKRGRVYEPAIGRPELPAPAPIFRHESERPRRRRAPRRRRRPRRCALRAAAPMPHAVDHRQRSGLSASPRDCRWHGRLPPRSVPHRAQASRRQTPPLRPGSPEPTARGRPSRSARTRGQSPAESHRRRGSHQQQQAASTVESLITVVLGPRCGERLGGVEIAKHRVVAAHSPGPLFESRPTQVSTENTRDVLGHARVFRTCPNSQCNVQIVGKVPYLQIRHSLLIA